MYIEICLNKLVSFFVTMQKLCLKKIYIYNKYS